MNKFHLILMLFVVLGMSCDKKTPAPAPEPEPVNPPAVVSGSLKIDFKHMVENEPLVFAKKYTNPMGDTFTVSKFIYYISNIVLEKSDNSKYTVPESYYLIDHSKSASTSITIKNIPVGSYKSLTYLIGVDSTRNCSGAQSGSLDPANGMFWTWSSGYIFMKLEGTAPKAANKSLTYHVGGFTGVNKTQRSVFHELTVTPITIAETTNPVVNMKVNVNEIFRSPLLIDFSTYNYQMSPGPKAKEMADNYADMTSILSITN